MYDSADKVHCMSLSAKPSRPILLTVGFTEGMRAPSHCRSSSMHAGGWLYQQADSLPASEVTFTPATSKQPSEQQMQVLLQSAPE